MSAELLTMLLVTEPVVDPAPMLTVPAEIVSGPVNVLAPLMVSVPDPDLVKVPVELITPE